MEQRVSLVTLGVADLARARAFYEALGWSSATDPSLGVAFFQTGGSVLALWDRDEQAADAGLEADPAASAAIVLAHNVRSPAEVDAVLDEARAAGATVVREGAATFWGGYSGLFADLDGHRWEVAHNPRWTIGPDGAVTLPAD
jgi:predicted lactoylglutathione lyase